MKVTRKQARVLAYLLEARHFPRPASSSEICRGARVGPGTYYPMAARLETNGWVETVEEMLPQGAVVPPRTFYALTERGTEWAQRVVDERKHRQSLWHRLTLRGRKPTPAVLRSRLRHTDRDAGLVEDVKADRAYWDDRYSE